MDITYQLLLLSTMGYKQRKNQHTKHGLNFTLACEVFDDANALFFYDVNHSEVEDAIKYR